MLTEEEIKNRRISPAGIALVKGRLRNGINCMPSPEFDAFLLNNHYFTEKGAPFSWLMMFYRYGIKTDLCVEFKRINKKYGDLPIAVELDMEILQWADKHNLDLLRDIFMIATLEALLQVCAKYKLDDTPIRAERRKYSDIPATVEECAYYQ